MSQNNEDRSQDGAEALANLPEGDRAATQAILDELEGEAPKPDEKPADAPAPDGKKPEDAAKPEDGKPADEGKKPDGEKPADQSEKPEGRRDTKLVPAWVLEAQKDKSQKEIDRLTADLAKATGTDPNGTAPANGAKDAPADEAALEKEAQEFAEKHGITEELAKDLLSRTRQNGTLPPEMLERLSEIDALKATREAEVETAKYNADFDSQILPIIKAEYGDDVPPEIVSKIREELKELAYSPDGAYAKVPYTMIYKGQDAFRELVPAVKQGAEGSRGGSSAGAGNGAGQGPDLTQPLSDDAVRALSDADFETYSANMEKRERETPKTAS